jgi:hypothetical protein
MIRLSLLALAGLLLACAMSVAGQQRLYSGLTLVVDREPTPPLVVAQVSVRKLGSASVCKREKRRERRREPDFPVWYPRNPGYGYTTYYTPYVRYGVVPTLSGYLSAYAYPSGYYGYRRYGSTRIVLGGRR